ncbi:MAG: hypothetical protein Kow0054_03990 [Deferrisoma sp.]
MGIKHLEDLAHLGRGLTPFEFREKADADVAHRRGVLETETLAPSRGANDRAEFFRGPDPGRFDHGGHPCNAG